MTTLGFDTATRATTVALWTPDGLELEARDDPPSTDRPRHTTRLVALIVDVLAEAGLDWGAIDRIAVGVGPGTFTGLRIGIATARGLATARDLPLVGISTLESLALGGLDAIAAGAADGEALPPLDAVAAVLDARRGEVFTAAWAPDWRPVIAPVATAPETMAERLSGLDRTVLAVGDGAVEFRGVLERSGSVVTGDHSKLHRVTAINHCRLAEGRRQSSPDEIQPEYLRLPDAEIARRTARRP